MILNRGIPQCIYAQGKFLTKSDYICGLPYTAYILHIFSYSTYKRHISKSDAICLIFNRSALLMFCHILTKNLQNFYIGAIFNILYEYELIFIQDVNCPKKSVSIFIKIDHICGLNCIFFKYLAYFLNIFYICIYYIQNFVPIG